MVFQLSYLKTMLQLLSCIFCFHYNFDFICSWETERFMCVLVEWGFEEILSFGNLPKLPLNATAATSAGSNA